MPQRGTNEIKKPNIWDKIAKPKRDADDKRGKFRWDMDKVYGRGMIRYLGNILEQKFPHIDIQVTDGTMTIKVTTSTVHTCPDNTINGDVVLNGNLTVNGNVQVNGSISATGVIHSDTDVTAAGVSLRSHTHMGVHGGTSAPS